MVTRGPYHDASKATREADEVMLDGPDGLAVSMTPEAARKTAQAIRAALADSEQDEPKPDCQAPPEDGNS